MLSQLCTAAETLLSRYHYDGEGHEQIAQSLAAGRERLDRLQRAADALEAAKAPPVKKTPTRRLWMRLLRRLFYDRDVFWCYQMLQRSDREIKDLKYQLHREKSNGHEYERAYHSNLAEASKNADLVRMLRRRVSILGRKLAGRKPRLP